MRLGVQSRTVIIPETPQGTIIHSSVGSYANVAQIRLCWCAIKLCRLTLTVPYGGSGGL